MRSFRDREVACSASERYGSNFESCVWRAVSSHSTHHPQEVHPAQFRLYLHKLGKGGLRPHSFFFESHILFTKSYKSVTDWPDHSSLNVFFLFCIIITYCVLRGDRFYTADSGVYKYILTYKDGPRTERVYFFYNSRKPIT